jgi:hypothetical protein
MPVVMCTGTESPGSMLAAAQDLFEIKADNRNVYSTLSPLHKVRKFKAY